MKLNIEIASAFFDDMRAKLIGATTVLKSAKNLDEAKNAVHLYNDFTQMLHQNFLACF